MKTVIKSAETADQNVPVAQIASDWRMDVSEFSGNGCLINGN